MSKYNIRNKHGRYAKLRNGSLYKVNGTISRFRGKTTEGKHRFTVHKIFGADVILKETKIERASKEEIHDYLN